jgi:anti-sigma factor RsiW
MNADLACQELVELLSDYLDDQLSRPSLDDVELHLADCPGCQVALEHLRFSVARTRSVEVAALTPEVRQRLLEEFRGITG